MARRAVNERWRCSSCNATTLDPCRTLGHRSTRVILVRGIYEAARPRRVMEAVAIANGVALVLVAEA